MQVWLKTTMMVILSVVTFLAAPFAFPFVLIGVYCVVFAPIFIALVWNTEKPTPAPGPTTSIAVRAKE